jgi:glycosyltransferase involved in cell wall biosynthesis
MSSPLVSICLPTYNYAHYLPEVISSCLNQSYEPIEIIIVDDASTDNSREVINSFGDPRILFAQNTVRLGLVGNWNEALSLARGEIIKFIFADDYLADNAIEEVVAACQDTRVNLVFSSARVIDGQGNYVYTHQPYPQSGRLPGPQEAKECLMRGNYIGGPSSVAVKAKAFEKVGTFNEALRFHVDQEMWIRILLRGDAYFLSPALVSVRQHDGSETRRLERANQIDDDTLRFLTICLQNEEIRSLLSASEAAELDRRRENLAKATSQTHSRLVFGMLTSKTPPYIKKALSPLYRRLLARARNVGRGS